MPKSRKNLELSISRKSWKKTSQKVGKSEELPKKAKSRKNYQKVGKVGRSGHPDFS